MTKTLTAIGIGVLSFAISACSSSNSPVSPTSQAVTDGTTADKPEWAAAARPGDLTIVGLVLQKDGEFDVLQAAVVRAGLVEALNGKTQYTVFAPTDAAFAKFLNAASEAAAISTVQGLPQDVLKNILLFHVTDGRRNSRSVLAAPSYQMLNGGTLTRTQLSAAGFAATDISASNGIVHVISAVLNPAR